MVPAYQVADDSPVGPRVLGPAGKCFVAPDLLCIEPGKSVAWVEAKHKEHWSWYGVRKRWEGGIDVRDWANYRRLREVSGVPIWIMFLVQSDKPHPSDVKWLPVGKRAPTGLYGIEVADAQECVRTAPQWARGMAYWPIEEMERFASLEDVVGEVPAQGDLFGDRVWRLR